MTAVHTWVIRQRANEDFDRSESMGWLRMTVSPEAGEDCERLERDNGLCMMGLCALCWMRMLRTAGSESKSLRSCWLRLNGTIVAVSRVRVYADSSPAYRCLCELY